MFADQWFAHLQRKTHKLIAGKDQKLWKAKVDTLVYTTVKLAILDSEIASPGSEQRNLVAVRSRIVGDQNFTGDRSSWDEDDYGHRIVAATLVAQVAKYAELYIAHVFKKGERKWIPDQDTVELAIKRAVDDRKVEFTNMSFGWDYNDHDGVERVLEYAGCDHSDCK
jgi:hypothetical protein